MIVSFIMCFFVAQQYAAHTHFLSPRRFVRSTPQASMLLPVSLNGSLWVNLRWMKVSADLSKFCFIPDPELAILTVQRCSHQY